MAEKGGNVHTLEKGVNAPTLVKFDKPILVDFKKSLKIIPAHAAASRVSSFGDLTLDPDPATLPTALCQDQGLLTKEVEDILNAILPPREWEEEGKVWKRTISNQAPTRMDVILLRKELDARLKLRQARPDGICPIRRELYTQAFDELIRQVTLDCGERGLLLLRVRDEIRMTLSAYQALHNDATAFGNKKAVGAEVTRDGLKGRFDELNAEKTGLEKELKELRIQIHLADRTYLEQKDCDDKDHFEQIQFYKRVNQLLKQQFEGLVNMKKF